jgi:DsbC/DsbD-like thiol-disulfide interchange protein/cytochrome c biogenesis protein CcdA
MGDAMTARRWVAMIVRMLLLAGGGLATGAIASAAAPTAMAVAEHVSVRMVAESTVPAPGKPDAIAIEITPRPGWHIYWRNPGDSGYAPRLDWHLPTGVTAGAVMHPVPTMMTIGGIASNVHVGRTILIDTLRFPPGIAQGARLPIGLDLDLLTCSESMCVPQSLSLAITLIAGDGAFDAAAAHLFGLARQALPAPVAGEAHMTLDRGLLRLAIPIGAAKGQPVRAFFDDVGIAAPGATQAMTSKSDRVIVSMPALAASLPSTLSGVVSLRRADGTLGGVRFAAVQGPIGTIEGGTGAAGIALALAAAIAGGLLLNLMPCVFPILSLKAMALARAGGDQGEARAEAIGYTVGAVGMIVALGAIVLALRAAGSQIGWAFQLQNPHIVALLLLLVVAIATNLAGLYELPTLNVAGGRTSGFAGGLGTGALAAFIATPCTGPFMAGALGAALMLPVPAALAIFAGLGLGLALPFLIIGFVEPARRWLPRPGQWMVTLRHLLSLPMFATAIGLAWVLGRQAGVGAMTSGLAAATALALALWWLGNRQHRGRSGGAPLLAGAVAIGVALALPIGAATAGSDAAQTALHAQPYSARRLAALRAGRQPVFVYLTADWCLTCKVNEASTLDSTTVADVFRKANVAVLRGDWSDGAPAITALLQRYHRAGVPLYLYFPPGGAAKVLPQVLTPAIVTDTVTT